VSGRTDWSLRLGELLSGGSRWPVTFRDWEAAARVRLPREVFDYVAGGAGTEQGVENNLAALRRWQLVPRLLDSAEAPSLSVSLFGSALASPVMLAPLGGVPALCDPEGEIAVARAAERLGIPVVLSTAASTSMEQVASHMPITSRWFQLYPVNDRAIIASFVRRAEASGYDAIVLTLDSLTIGWKPRDLANAYSPFRLGVGAQNFFTDPAFRDLIGSNPFDDVAASGRKMLSVHNNLGMRIRDVEWLRQQTTLPILAKGVLRAADALALLDAGLDGIVVSNHGGRQVDGVIPAVDVLAPIRDAVPDECPVLFDSGIRTGADIVKVLALGADAVLVGRPYVYALAVGGDAGVEAYLLNLLAELQVTVSTLGYSSVAELDRGAVRHGG
jgi:lactate 2-monooxygenase